MAHTKCSYCHFLILLIGHAEPVSNNVYWENLAKAFQQNPREIMHGIETSKERLNSGRHMFRDQHDLLKVLKNGNNYILYGITVLVNYMYTIVMLYFNTFLED
jgi:hypothetical protein